MWQDKRGCSSSSGGGWMTDVKRRLLLCYFHSSLLNVLKGSHFSLSLSFLLVEKGLFQKTTKGARWNLGPSSSLRRHTGETRATTFNKRKESRTNERDSLAPQLINKPTPKKKKKYTQERDGTEERECLKRLVYQGETTLHLLVLHTLFQIHFFLFQKKKKKSMHSSFDKDNDDSRAHTAWRNKTEMACNTHSWKIERERAGFGFSNTRSIFFFFGGCDYKRNPRGLHTCADAANNHLHKSYSILFSRPSIYAYMYIPFCWPNGNPNHLFFRHEKIFILLFLSDLLILHFEEIANAIYRANGQFLLYITNFLTGGQPTKMKINFVEKVCDKGKERKRTARGRLNYKHTQTGGSGGR